MKANKQKVGYLFTYKAIPTPKDVEFAKFHNIKLVTHLNIYSKHNDINPINKILLDRSTWNYDNEIKYLKYELEKVIEITNSNLLLIRQSSFWIVEKRELPEMVGNENVVVYTCFTNLHHLKYLKGKYTIKLWMFSDKKNSPSHKLKNISHYNKLINKGRVLVDDPVLASQCLKIRAKKGHKVEYITGETFTKKHVTSPTELRKPISNKLVCITDGKTVVRLKKSDAEERISKCPILHYCTKEQYYKYLRDLRGPKSEKTDKKPILSIQGSKESVNVETGKKSDVRTRKERRFSLQKKKQYSKMFRPQFVTGKWVTESETPEEKVEVFVESGEHKRITHRIRPTLFTKPWYNPLKRKKAIQYEEEEKLVKRMVISKFPYGKEIVVNYTDVDKDGVVHHIKKEHCKMLNKKIIQEDPETNEQIVICSVKNVISWMHQEDYPKDNNTDIDASKWIQYVSITTDTKIIKNKPKFVLLRKPKKTKKWRHPISDNECEKKHRPF